MKIPRTNSDPWRWRTAAFVLLTVGLAASAAGADEVRLESGQTVQGIARRDLGKVVVETGLGTLIFPAEQVKEIVPGRTAMNEYPERLAALGPRPAAAEVYALALWAREKNLVRYVYPLLQRALSIDPGFAPAHEALGQVWRDGRWTTAGERATREAALTRAMAPPPPAPRARPLPEISPGYVYFGFHPMPPPRGSQVHGDCCFGTAVPVFHGVAVLP